MTSEDEKKSTDDRSRDLSPGKLLVWGREHANLTQEQVAHELYMTITKVKSLESDDYRYMGSSTFVRGYLRAYANLVNLDVAQVMAAYDRYLQKTGAAESPVVRRPDPANKPLWQFVVVILVTLLILWLISLWFFNKRQPPVVNRPAPVVPQLDIVQPISSAASSIAEDHSADSSTEQSSVEQSSIAASESAQSSLAASEVSASVSSAVISSTAVSSTPRLVTADDTLSVLALSFSAECWLEVSDARGDVLAADLYRAGSQVDVKGVAPFEVKLGNAHAATVELNGEPVEIKPLVGTNVLSLTVGQ